MNSLAAALEKANRMGSREGKSFPAAGQSKSALANDTRSRPPFVTFYNAQVAKRSTIH